jgi:hypothetical protein
MNDFDRIHQAQTRYSALHCETKPLSIQPIVEAMLAPPAKWNAFDTAIEEVNHKIDVWLNEAILDHFARMRRPRTPRKLKKLLKKQGRWIPRKFYTFKNIEVKL